MLLGPRRDLEQDDRLLRQGRRGLPGARRQAGRGDSSASRPAEALLAEQCEAIAIAAGVPGGAPQPMPPAHPRPPPAAAKRTHDGGGDLTLDEVRPLLRKALKLTAPRSKHPTIGGGLNRSTAATAGPPPG